jgi:hypothetical protein
MEFTLSLSKGSSHRKIPDARRIDRARLGALTGVYNDTRGTYYFDAFESHRQTHIVP